jgi:hypothetical protein
VFAVEQWIAQHRAVWQRHFDRLDTRARLWDRVIDGQVMTPMQKIVLDALRPEDAHDAYGVAEARAYRAVFPLPWPADVA